MSDGTCTHRLCSVLYENSRNPHSCPKGRYNYGLVWGPPDVDSDTTQGQVTSLGGDSGNVSERTQPTVGVLLGQHPPPTVCSGELCPTGGLWEPAQKVHLECQPRARTRGSHPPTSCPSWLDSCLQDTSSLHIWPALCPDRGGAGGSQVEGHSEQTLALQEGCGWALTVSATI